MGFTGPELSEIYRQMRMIRSFEEKLPATGLAIGI